MPKVVRAGDVVSLGTGFEREVEACVPVAAARALLSQCVSFVGFVPQVVYTAESQIMFGGTLGKHLRHVVDHYEAILRGWRESGLIDYYHRARDVPMETSREAAERSLLEVSRELSMLSEHDMSKSVRVRSMVASDGTETESVSSLARELLFATHHGMHHQAMMRIIAEEYGVSTFAEFGKAPPSVKGIEQAFPSAPVELKPAAFWSDTGGVASIPLQPEAAAFERDLPELLRSAPGRYVSYFGHDCLGTFDTEEAAFEAGYDRAGFSRPFLVRRVEPQHAEVASTWDQGRSLDH